MTPVPPGEPIRTRHIRAMIREALTIADELDGKTCARGEGVKEPRALERAANLLRHAAEELDDERLRARDGWPVV